MHNWKQWAQFIPIDFDEYWNYSAETQIDINIADSSRKQLIMGRFLSVGCSIVTQWCSLSATHPMSKGKKNGSPWTSRISLYLQMELECMWYPLRHSLIAGKWDSWISVLAFIPRMDNIYYHQLCTWAPYDIQKFSKTGILLIFYNYLWCLWHPGVFTCKWKIKRYVKLLGPSATSATITNQRVGISSFNFKRKTTKLVTSTKGTHLAHGPWQD